MSFAVREGLTTHLLKNLYYEKDYFAACSSLHFVICSFV